MRIRRRPLALLLSILVGAVVAALAARTPLVTVSDKPPTVDRDAPAPPPSRQGPLPLRIVDAGAVGIPPDSAGWGHDYLHATHAFHLFADSAPWVDDAAAARVADQWSAHVQRMAAYGNNAITLELFLQLVTLDSLDAGAVYAATPDRRHQHAALRQRLRPMLREAGAHGMRVLLQTDLPAYTTPLLMYLLIPIMIVGSTPFTLYYISYRRRKLSIFGNRQVLLLVIFLIGGASLVALDLSSLGGMGIPDAVRQGLFITTAAISTTGFPITGLSHLPAVTLILLTLLMFIGGSSESTAGGIKLARIIIGYRGIAWWFKRMFARSKVLVPFTYAGENVPASVAEQEISKNMLVIILSFLTVCLATIVALQFNMFYPDVTSLIFDIVSAMSSCGLSAGYVSAGMPLASKWVFILVMWIGRLEVIPVIVLFMGIFRGSR